ncbi:MAG TPA: SMP-30/gluconolactonase/LRE family protein [Nevskiaceae bacterium]|nr:SMP-30/gluconolactonase/LRE family protein [Nevskiaceae bacterium]
MRLRSVVLILILAAGLVLALGLPPARIDPVAWTPPPAPAAVDDATLDRVQTRVPELGAGGEGLALDAQGRVLAGLADGRLRRYDPRSGAIEDLGSSGGRPLGLVLDAEQRLVIADPLRGLLRREADGRLTVLSTGTAERPARFIDDVDTHAEDPRLYFTDASDRFGYGEHQLEALEHRPNGRLLRFDPASGRTETLASHLYFANGVALGPAAAYALVTETSAYRISRVWLTGERRGEREVFAENLPGFPDNLSYDPLRRCFWVALYAPRSALLDALLPHPQLRRWLSRLPAALQPHPAHHPQLLAFEEDGRRRHHWQSRLPASYGPITSVEADAGGLWLGSLSASGIGRLELPVP